MQMFVIPKADGSFIVLKHIMLQPSRLHVSLMEEVCVGQAMQIDYGSNFKSGGLALQLNCIPTSSSLNQQQSIAYTYSQRTWSLKEM